VPEKKTLKKITQIFIFFFLIYYSTTSRRSKVPGNVWRRGRHDFGFSSSPAAHM